MRKRKIARFGYLIVSVLFCCAAEYGNKLNLTYEEIDRIIRQGKELGIYMYIYTGGEPLVRKKDLIRLCETHDDCVFLCFTNARLSVYQQGRRIQLCRRGARRVYECKQGLRLCKNHAA